MSRIDADAALSASAGAWRSATASLQDLLREHVHAIAPDVLAREPVLAWVSAFPPAGPGDGRSWRAEPCHPFFGDGIAVHGVEDLGEAGDRGAGGPYCHLGHVLLTDLTEDDARSAIRVALADVRAAAEDYQAVLRGSLSDLEQVTATGGDVLELVRAAPAGEAVDGLSWRAEPRSAADGASAAAVFLERDADDPRRVELVGLALMQVAASA